MLCSSPQGGTTRGAPMLMMPSGGFGIITADVLLAEGYTSDTKVVFAYITYRANGQTCEIDPEDIAAGVDLDVDVVKGAIDTLVARGHLGVWS